MGHSLRKSSHRMVPALVVKVTMGFTDKIDGALVALDAPGFALPKVRAGGDGVFCVTARPNVFGGGVGGDAITMYARVYVCES